MAQMIICILIFHLSVICCDREPPIDVENPTNVNIKSSTSKQPAIPIVNIIDPKTTSQNVTISKATNAPNIKSNSNSDAIESGAVMRGVFVFVGIALLFITYLVFKTYRRTTKKHVRVKKYGVRTKRTDTEMEPLPLDDEEEDETVFELKSVNNR